MALTLSQDREIEELQRQLGQAQKELGWLRSYCFALRQNLDTALYIKQKFAEGDILGAKQAWNELSQKEKIALYMAPTKGGFLTTKERELIRQPGFNE